MFSFDPCCDWLKNEDEVALEKSPSTVAVDTRHFSTFIDKVEIAGPGNCRSPIVQHAELRCII